MKTLILLLVLLSLSACKTTYNYIVITPAKETKKTEIQPFGFNKPTWGRSVGVSIESLKNNPHKNEIL